MDPTDSCRIREHHCPLREGLYYMPLVQAPQEIGTAIAEPATAVQPTAEPPRPEHGVDKCRTQESEELSEETERLHQRW